MATLVHAPSSPEPQGSLFDAEASLHPAYAQNNWGYTIDVDDHDNHKSHNLPAANGIWMGMAAPASYCDTTTAFSAPLSVAAWSDHGTAPEGSAWDSPANPLPSFGPDRPLWPVAPTNAAFTNPWCPRNQPIPSPLSEAPPYIVTQSPPTANDEDNGLNGERLRTEYSTSYSHKSSTTGTTTPSPSYISGSRPRDKPKSRANHSPIPSSSASNLKRPATPATTTAAGGGGPEQDEPTIPRQRTPKRQHRSDTGTPGPSPAVSTASSMTTTTTTTTTTATTTATAVSNTSNSTTATTGKTTLGGVLPADVDPRIACERIRRQAWERSSAQALEMAQRRTMLRRGHEHGALEREMERLRVNLGLMKQREREDCLDLN
ncbi:hypothetical protein N658DRAFT_509230 [Parathielavia hyrcaniae]|uniref:Uncharacterized protein n=1 Tax=Parathielavia hyrcaniae TaxID=113614 RepID=A0AAN6SYS1_9PEZI|nr:hypothetical protein N658DRAFT_509230 [Parathielavia hyrcaniae]